MWHEEQQPLHVPKGGRTWRWKQFFRENRIRGRGAGADGYKLGKFPFPVFSVHIDLTDRLVVWARQGEQALCGYHVGE